MKTNFLMMKPGNWLVSFIFLLTLFTSGQVYAQKGLTVKGIVIDAETKAPLPGVNIVELSTISGSVNGTISNYDGTYELQLTTDNATLLMTYIGFADQEVAVNGRSTIDVSMEVDSETLDEVVVIGYSEQKKSDVTGSVGSVEAESITERNFTNPVEAIQGNVAGVQISSSTGRIGDGFDITIRGKNSMSSDADPLYVVDGVPTDGIDFLNPQDIARIDILKDASSTAIYGSRGSNGVIIVTTKSGATAKPGINFSFDSFVGIKDPARLPDMMSGEKWWYYHQSAYLATAKEDPDTGTVTEQTLYDAVIGTGNSLLEQRANNNEAFDWYDAVLKTGIQQNHYLSASGTSGNGISYNLGLGFQNETGNIENESLDKYTFKFGLLNNINEKFSAGANFTMALTDQDLGSDLAMREAFRLNPFLTPYGLDGELFPLPGKLVDEEGNFLINKTSTYNPLLEIENSVDNIRRWNGVGSIFVQYYPVEWLSFKSTISGGADLSRRGKSWGAETNTGVNNRDLASAEISKSENFNYTWDNQFNINRDFGDDHTVSLLGLQSIFYSTIETSVASSRYMPFNTSFYNLGSGDQGTYTLGSGFTKQTLSSYAIRVNYAFKDRYLLTLSSRWDGSSLLSETNRWDNFPSGAVAWRISEEAFMTDQEVVSNLKLRVSYGFTGNNIIAPYSTQNGLDLQTYYDFNGTNANGWLPSALANKALGWEKTKELNVGLDFGVLENRITGSVDVYDRLSDELLLEQQLPRESGWETIRANVGSVSNKGVELVLTTTNISTQKVSWQTTFTFTKNTNEIKSIYGQDEVDDVGNGLFIGESIDAHYNYKFIGIWQANEATEAAEYGMEEGQEKLLDVDGNGEYDPDKDRIILGSSNPDWTGSVFSRLTVGNFDLSASLITHQGVFVYSPFHANFTDTRDRGRQKLDIDWYVPANDAGLPAQYSNSYPQPRNEGSYWRNDGVGYYRDASFVKVKNIALGYTLSNSLTEKLGLRSCRVYTNVLNPFVFTDYDGYDPEWAAADFNIGRVSSVTYQFGVSVKF